MRHSLLLVSLAVSSAFNIMNEAPSSRTILTHSTAAYHRRCRPARTPVHHVAELTSTQASAPPPARCLPPASSLTLWASIHGIVKLTWEFHLTHTVHGLNIGI